MSFLSDISRNVTGKTFCMADLVDYANGCITKYAAEGAIIQQVRINFDDHTEPELKSKWMFDLPIKKQKLSYLDKNKPVYNIGLKQTRKILEDEIENFLLSKFYIDYSNLDSIRRPKYAHYTKFDENLDAFLHILHLEIESDNNNRIIYNVISILEKSGEIENSRIFNDHFLYQKYKDKIESLKEFFSNYYRFSDRQNIFDPEKKTIILKPDDTDFINLFSLLMNQYIRTFSFVSRGLIEYSWEDALKTGRRGTDLPWEMGEPRGARVPTATLSIDLRRSTSLMEQAEDRAYFAIWLESLSEICRAIVHHNHGIFDKFTGDGVIAHFATNEEPAGTEGAGGDCDPNLILSIDRAFTCGCELIRALQLHLDALRPRLRFNIATSGPAVGLAFDDASWSLDRDGRPIVVGKGVVNACRLNNGKAGWLRMAYNMKRRLSSDIFKLADRRLRPVVLGDHKDLRSDLEPECFQMTDVNVNIGRSRAELRVEVARISRQVEREHGWSGSCIARDAPVDVQHGGAIA